MPHAKLVVKRTAHTQLGSNQELVEIAIKLRGLIAGCLTCVDDGGNLQADDVEIEIVDRDWRHVGGDKYDVTLTVFAKEFPSRRINPDLFMNTLTLTKGLQGLLPEGVTGFAWVLLCPAAFVEFGSEKKY
jgi:hypothetical protein